MKKWIRTVRVVGSTTRYKIYLTYQDPLHTQMSVYQVEKWTEGLSPIYIKRVTINEVWKHKFDEDYILPRYVINAILAERNKGDEENEKN